MVEVLRSVASWAVPGLLLLCYGPAGCYASYNTPDHSLPDCPDGATCWDFTNAAIEQLREKGWYFEDPWWDVQGGMVSTRAFPSMASPSGIDCAAQSPQIMGPASGKLRLRILHTVSQVKDLESGTKVLVRDAATQRDELVLQVQRTDSVTETLVPFKVAPGAGFNIRLQLHAGRNTTLVPNVWQIQRIDVIPLP